MQLQAYLARIGYRGDYRPDIHTLRGLLRAHVCTVPFENLDVQLKRTVTTAPEDAYDKIVNRRRGGWCYEQNGLFGWALGQIGFEVTRVAAAVKRNELGDAARANHLALLVSGPDGAGPFLADVGFGGGLFEPLLLAEQEAWHEPFRVGLRPLDDGHWQFREDAGDGEFSYDFLAEAACEGALARKCERLQTDPESTFVLNLVAQIRAPDRHTALRGRVLTQRDASGEVVRILDSPEQLLQTLSSRFGLDVPAIANCWPKILTRHEQLFGVK